MNDAATNVLSCRGLAKTYTGGPQDILTNRSLWTQTAADAFNTTINERASDAEMEELISAAYLQFGARFGKLRVTAGFRGERTDLESKAYQRITAASAQATLNATLSAGLAMLPAGAASFGDLLSAADRALYEAKKAGRNRTIADTEGEAA